MARIRSIKPEYWIDEKVTDLNPWARLLFIGMWNFADDQGYIDDKPRRIKMQVFPGDDLDIADLIADLVAAGLLTPYDSPVGPVLHIRNWDKHQKVDRASGARFDPSTLVVRTPPPRVVASVQVEPPREDSTNGIEGSLASLDAEGKGSGSGRDLDLDLDLEGIPRRASRSRPPDSSAFDRFWNAYPRRVAKDDARKAWAKAISRADPEQIIAAAERFRDDPARDPQFTAHPATWLNGGRWADDPLPRGSPRGQREHNGRLLNEGTIANLEREQRIANGQLTTPFAIEGPAP